MWRTACLWLCVAAAGPAAHAAAGPEAFVLLDRARLAARQLDYRGEFVLQRGPEVSRTLITHRRPCAAAPTSKPSCRSSGA